MSEYELLRILNTLKPIKRNKTTKDVRRKILTLIKYLTRQENCSGQKKTKALMIEHWET